MAIDYGYELQKIQKELKKIETLGEDISDSVRNSLEDLLNWAKAGYQKQALREQLKNEFQKIIPEKKELIKTDLCKEASQTIKEVRVQLKDSFSSKSGEKIQKNLTSLGTASHDLEQDIEIFKRSIKLKYNV